MKKWFLICGGWLGICAIVLCCLFFLTDTFKSSPIPENVRKQVHFATYYPSSLPEGYVIQPQSYEITQNVLSYTISGPQSSTINVSQQQVPESFDFEEFHTKILKNKRTSKTADSTGIYLGTLEQNNVASIRTHSTWILMTGEAREISLDKLEAIAAELRQ